MSTSTNAMLFFGWQVADPESTDLPCPPWLAGCGWEEEYAKRIGVGVSDPKVQKSVVEIVDHCCDSYPMYCVGIRATRTTAYRGSPETVTTTEDGRHDWNQELTAFCTLMELPIPPEGGTWLLASYWSG